MCVTNLPLLECGHRNPRRKLEFVRCGESIRNNTNYLDCPNRSVKRRVYKGNCSTECRVKVANEYLGWDCCRCMHLANTDERCVGYKEVGERRDKCRHKVCEACMF